MTRFLFCNEIVVVTILIFVLQGDICGDELFLMTRFLFGVTR